MAQLMNQASEPSWWRWLSWWSR